MNADRLVSERERLVFEAAIRLLGYSSIKDWAESKEDLSYSWAQKVLAGNRRPGALASRLREAVRLAGLSGRLPQEG